MTFYEINQAMLDCIVTDPETGEAVGIDTEKLESLQMEKREKLIACAQWASNLESDEEQLKQKKMQFAKWQASVHNQRENLLAFMASVMDDDIKQDGIQIKRRTSVKAEPTNLEDIPEFYKRYKWEPDKAAALKAMKAGTEIPGFQLVENHTVSIKGV